MQNVLSAPPLRFPAYCCLFPTFIMVVAAINFNAYYMAFLKHLICFLWSIANKIYVYESKIVAQIIGMIISLLLLRHYKIYHLVFTFLNHDASSCFYTCKLNQITGFGTCLKENLSHGEPLKLRLPCYLITPVWCFTWCPRCFCWYEEKCGFYFNALKT